LKVLELLRSEKESWAIRETGRSDTFQRWDIEWSGMLTPSRGVVYEARQLVSEMQTGLPAQIRSSVARSL